MDFGSGLKRGIVGRVLGLGRFLTARGLNKCALTDDENVSCPMMILVEKDSVKCFYRDGSGGRPWPIAGDEPEQMDRDQSVKPPVTDEEAEELVECFGPDEEAEELVECFGPDDCFSLAWSLVHLVETSPTCVIV